MADAVAIAKLIGENPLAAFSGALFVLLITLGISWLVIHHLYIRRQRLPDSAAARSFTATVALGFASIVVATVLFSVLPARLGIDGVASTFDAALTDALRSNVSQPMLQIFAAITFLANTATLWVLAASVATVLLWRRQYLFAFAWTVALAGNGLLTRVLKGVFARERPLFGHVLFPVQGWSFPSGHASGAVVAYGMLAYVLIRFAPPNRHLPIVLIAAAAAFTIGCSRIFLQVHYASDVLAGFASGSAWLAICIIAAEAIRARRLKSSNAGGATRSPTRVAARGANRPDDNSARVR